MVFECAATIRRRLDDADAGKSFSPLSTFREKERDTLADEECTIEKMQTMGEIT